MKASMLTSACKQAIFCGNLNLVQLHFVTSSDALVTNSFLLLLVRHLLLVAMHLLLIDSCYYCLETL